MHRHYVLKWHAAVPYSLTFTHLHLVQIICTAPCPPLRTSIANDTRILGCVGIGARSLETPFQRAGSEGWDASKPYSCCICLLNYIYVLFQDLHTNIYLYLYCGAFRTHPFQVTKRPTLSITDMGMAVSTLSRISTDTGTP